MLFTLEVLNAAEGDCLLLHYGPPDEPSLILIDGGPPGVWAGALKPRLQALRAALDDGAQLILNRVIVTHIDNDHIGGICKLFEELLDCHEAHRSAPYSADSLWHNSFDDVIGTAVSAEAASLADHVASEPSNSRRVRDLAHAIAAGTKQGQTLRDIADTLRTSCNWEFDGLVMRPDDSAPVLPMGHGLEFTILGPTAHQIADYQARWDKDLRDLAKDVARPAGFDDDSEFNLASMAVLAELGGRTMLLTGDARGDHIRDGLVAAGRLAGADDSCHVDVFKLPHHGSRHNVTEELLAQVTADHYVISANGRYGNPDVETLRWLAAARGDDEYTLHLTFPENAYRDLKPGTQRYEALAAIQRWLDDERPESCAIDHLEGDADPPSLRIHLGDLGDDEL